MTREEIKDYIDKLEDYQGYIQYSNRPISKKDDIFIEDNPKVDEQQGFIPKKSIPNHRITIIVL